MNDNDFIQAIAREWVRLGGDSDGVAWTWLRLKEAVKAIEQSSQVCITELERLEAQESSAAQTMTANDWWIFGAIIAAPLGFIVGLELSGRLKPLEVFMLVVVGCLVLLILFGGRNGL